MPTGIRRSLFIGLGGTGMSALLHTKKIFVDTYGQVPPMIGFLGIDTDGNVYNKSLTLNNGQKINLTNKFISLACASYTDWENFANHLDKALAAFIHVYKPAFFERIGLRYVNFISKTALCLKDVPFSDMIDSRYLGLMTDEELDERHFTRCSVDADVAIRGGCRVKIHAGPGIVKRNGKQDTEVKFIFDQDLYMSGKTPVNLSTAALQTLHLQAFSIFRSAITDTLHNAMDPQNIG